MKFLSKNTSLRYFDSYILYIWQLLFAKQCNVNNTEVCFLQYRLLDAFKSTLCTVQRTKISSGIMDQIHYKTNIFKNLIKAQIMKILRKSDYQHTIKFMSCGLYQDLCHAIWMFRR